MKISKRWFINSECWLLSNIPSMEACRVECGIFIDFEKYCLSLFLSCLVFCQLHVTLQVLILDLMQECYVILFPDVFQFFIWRHSCFVVHFHITSQKRQGNEIGILLFTLRTRENNEKLKLSSTNKTRFFFVSNFWCACV